MSLRPKNTIQMYNSKNMNKCCMTLAVFVYHLNYSVQAPRSPLLAGYFHLTAATLPRSVWPHTNFLYPRVPLLAQCWSPTGRIHLSLLSSTGHITAEERGHESHFLSLGVQLSTGTIHQSCIYGSWYITRGFRVHGAANSRGKVGGWAGAHWDRCVLTAFR